MKVKVERIKETLRRNKNGAQKQQREITLMKSHIDEAVQEKLEAKKKLCEFEAFVSRLQEENTVAVKQIVKAKNEMSKMKADYAVTIDLLQREILSLNGRL